MPGSNSEPYFWQTSALPWSYISSSRRSSLWAQHFVFYSLYYSCVFGIISIYCPSCFWFDLVTLPFNWVEKIRTSVQFSVKTTSFYISHGWQSNWFFLFSMNCVSFLHRRPGFASASLEWLPKRKSLLPTSDERALGGMSVRREALRTGCISVQGMMQTVRWWCVEMGFNCSRLSLYNQMPHHTHHIQHQI